MAEITVTIPNQAINAFCEERGFEGTAQEKLTFVKGEMREPFIIAYATKRSREIGRITSETIRDEITNLT